MKYNWTACPNRSYQDMRNLILKFMPDCQKSAKNCMETRFTTSAPRQRAAVWPSYCEARYRMKNPWDWIAAGSLLRRPEVFLK